MKGSSSILIIVIGSILAGCKADMICPSYQSYFILDAATQKSQFTYFALDSLPRRDVFNSSKDENGLVAKTSLLAYVDNDWVREREMRTIDMEVVYPQISDSILFAGDAMMYAETDVIDSVALDSARYASQSFRYGADQKYYNWYFRGKLSWKDELDKDGNKTTSNTEPVAEKKGFLKGLFRKKEKSIENADGVNQEAEPKEKKEKQPKPPRQKKEKKKKQVIEPVLEEVPTPAPQEEEDDGEDDF